MVEDSLRGVLLKSSLNRKVPASRPAQVVGGGGGQGHYSLQRPQHGADGGRGAARI